MKTQKQLVTIGTIGLFLTTFYSIIIMFMIASKDGQ